MSQAAIFPGQGAQVVGMGADAAQQFSSARDTFARADALLAHELERPLSAFCFDGPADALETTIVQQPAIFVTSVALYHAAIETGRIRAAQFTAMAGLSLGEYTALHLADALPFEDALRLVFRRGKLMQEAAQRAPGGMVSLLMMDEDKVLALCERVREHGRLRPANYNCPGQIVISGDKPACDAACALAEELGGKAVALKVAGAFHSELMKPAADEFRAALDDVKLARPRIRVLANVDAGIHAEPGAIRDSLYQQIFNPVRWQACVQRLIAEGSAEFWEIGPGRVLAGFLRRIDRKAKITNISTAADLAPPSTGGAP